MTNNTLANQIANKTRQQGFSLLETLVAFALLVLVFSVIMQIIGSGARSSHLTSQYSQATLIAQSKLAEFKLGLINESAGTELDRYHWQTSRHKANYADLGLEKQYQRSFTMYDLIVTVDWQSAGKQRKIEINTVQLVNNQ